VTLEDKDGRPWTAHLGLGWIVLILALSSGTAAFLLGIYLALWIQRRRRSGLALYCYGLIAALSLTTFLPLRLVHLHWDILGTLLSVLWLVAVYLLRHEIRQDARSNGYEIEIGPILTFLFSVVYINYCLNPLTFDHSAEESITLNLGARSNPQQ
jgi:hypothetical protein